MFTDHGSLTALLDSLRATGNPISQEEIDELRTLARKAEAGDRLTLGQALRLNELTQKVASEKEYRTHPGLTALLTLAVALAAYLLTRE